MRVNLSALVAAFAVIHGSLALPTVQIRQVSLLNLYLHSILALKVASGNCNELCFTCQLMLVLLTQNEQENRNKLADASSQLVKRNRFLSTATYSGLLYIIASVGVMMHQQTQLGRTREQIEELKQLAGERHDFNEQ